MTELIRVIGGEGFRHAGRLDALRDASGAVRVVMPQAQYAKAATTRLNPHGVGPFCDLVVPRLPHEPGVYGVTIAGSLVYVGIAVDLTDRWGPRGYSRIHPRNCFVGGQSTNCKVNAALTGALQAGRGCDLWIHITDRARAIEERLIRELNPPWNSQR
jgi:hypothetical protein